MFPHFQIPSLATGGMKHKKLVGCMSQSVSAGLGCGIGWTPAQLVPHSVDKHMLLAALYMSAEPPLVTFTDNHAENARKS